MLCQSLLYRKVTQLYTHRLFFLVFFSIMVYHSRCYIYLIVSSWCCSTCSSFHYISCELQVSTRCLISFKLDSQEYVPGTLHIVKCQKCILVSLNFSWSLLLKNGIRFSGCVLYAKYFAELSYLKSQNNSEERRWIIPVLCQRWQGKERNEHLLSNYWGPGTELSIFRLCSVAHFTQRAVLES